MTLIGIAAYYKQPTVFRGLLKRGADINAINQVCYHLVDICE